MKDKKIASYNNRKAVKYRGVECLNCSQPLDLSDVYCPYCSQLNSTKQLSLKDFVGQFLSSIFTYDSRLRYTIKDLLFKPGVMTRNYVNGQRLKYANPFRFYLSVSIIYFLLQGLLISLGSPDSLVNFNTDSALTANDTLSEANKENIKVTHQTNSIDDIKFTDDAIVLNNDTISTWEKKTAADIKFVSEEELAAMPWGERISGRYSLYKDYYNVYKIKDANVALDSLHHKNTPFNRWIYNKNDSVQRFKDSPVAFFEYMIQKIPFFLFFFTPFFAIFFWLIYSKSKFSFIEHMIFIFHIFSFLFLAMLLILIPDILIGAKILTGILFLLIGPFYFYKALRNFYKQGRLLTIIKFVFLNIVFGISATFAISIFFLISAATY
ncbi:DUF3667 domain-containing protein [Ulvibacter antarcticus]|uniref:Uncharacterized protein DUF3667 n=1 Tax=Ulvibacter antarcticus TaxID=442714 RepID=A0A3L9YE70_9FLAO|nr:DUF3667 domain-containing protein [Ulvibacter antarcticus]RMA57747.1 uncharacterized protein DUF3667 [Ulvibacter antarcticus]